MMRMRIIFFVFFGPNIMAASLNSMVRQVMETLSMTTICKKDEGAEAQGVGT